MSVTFTAADNIYCTTGEDEYGPIIEAVYPEMNVSNSNVFAVLIALGIEADYCGSILATDLADACARATALDDAVAKPTVTHGGDTFATFIDCGRPADYMVTRLTALAEVARSAIDTPSGMVTWG